MRKLTKKSVIGASITLVLVASATSFGLHAQKQSQYANNATVVENLTTLSFETKALSGEQKTHALDVSEVKNRALVTAGLCRDLGSRAIDSREVNQSTFLWKGRSQGASATVS